MKISRRISVSWEVLLFPLIFCLLCISILVLYSLAPHLFPQYFSYIIIGLILFILFNKIGFDIFSIFFKQLYWGSIFLLILPLIIGQVTRGTVRWIPIGPLSLQPSEIVRPLLFIFFANYLIKDDIGLKRLLITFLYMILPLTLILLQPSLGVTILTSIGFIGIILSSSIKKSHILSLFLVGILLLPLFWILMKPYQKVRILSFINPQNDPRGTGYNSIQSMIAVGSGGLIGRGLGKGIQTQLEFLPEKQTDFIFAAISEEFGFFGATITLGLLFFLYILLIRYAENAYNPQGRAFVSVVVLVFVAETFIHIGMNMGILPITGVPLPLLSSGGSSLMGTLITLGLVVSIKKNQL